MKTHRIPFASALALLIAVACAPPPASDSDATTTEPAPVGAVATDSQGPADGTTSRDAGDDPTTPPLQIRNAAAPLPGLVTGGQPTEEELARAAELGFTTVINLRTDAEEIPFDERATVEALGMEYVAIPVSGAADLTQDNVATLAEVLTKTEGQKVLFHCASGNRVGALLALKAHWLDGASPENALALGKASGLTRLEPAVVEILQVP